MWIKRQLITSKMSANKILDGRIFIMWKMNNRRTRDTNNYTCDIVHVVLFDGNHRTFWIVVVCNLNIYTSLSCSLFFIVAVIGWCYSLLSLFYSLFQPWSPNQTSACIQTLQIRSLLVHLHWLFDCLAIFCLRYWNFQFQCTRRQCTKNCPDMIVE